MNSETYKKKILCLACGYAWEVEIPKEYEATVDEETGYPLVINKKTSETITFQCPVCKVTMNRLRWR